MFSGFHNVYIRHKWLTFICWGKSCQYVQGYNRNMSYQELFGNVFYYYSNMSALQIEVHFHFLLAKQTTFHSWLSLKREERQLLVRFVTSESKQFYMNISNTKCCCSTL